jgi:DNA repair and recombination protein RAD52
VCTVTAGGVTRQDVGFGSGFAKMIGDAIEGATKEAVTDALKRCLRTFGHPFGLALYDKERAHVQAAPPPPEFISDEERIALEELCEEHGVDKVTLCGAAKVTSLAAIKPDRLESAQRWVIKNTTKKEAA